MTTNVQVQLNTVTIEAAEPRILAEKLKLYFIMYFVYTETQEFILEMFPSVHKLWKMFDRNISTYFSKIKLT